MSQLTEPPRRSTGPPGPRYWQRVGELCVDVGNLGTACAGLLALSGAATPTWVAGIAAVAGYTGAMLCKALRARR